MESVFPIQVTSFVNPHLFWIFNLNDESKRDILNQQLQNVPSKSVKINVNQIVLTKTEDEPKIYKRAILKGLEIKNRVEIYTCWLVDYGLVVKSRYICSIPQELLDIPPFVKQACLNNTVGLHKLFLDGVKCEESSKFSVGTVKMSQEYISTAKQLFFDLEKEMNNIYCGEVIIVDNHIEHKFTDLLVKRQIVSINEDKFQEFFMDNIRFFENNFLDAIKNIVQFPTVKKTVSSPRTNTYSDLQSNINNNLTKIVLDNIEINEVGIGRGRFRKHKQQVRKTSVNSRVNHDYVDKWVEKSASSNDITYSDFESDLIQEERKNNVEESSSELKDVKDVQQSCLESKTSKGTFLNKIRKSYKKSEEDSKTTQFSSTTTEDENSGQLKISKSSDSSLESDKGINSSTTNDNSDDEDDDLFYRNKRPTIGCTCGSCLDWNEKDPLEKVDGQHKIVGNTENKTTTTTEKPSLLFKIREDTEEQIEIKSQTSARFRKLQSKTKLENFASPKLLIHGSSIPAPAEKVRSVPFDPEIHKSLDRLGFKEARQVQTFTWPALRRRTHVFIVSGPKSGKTITYIPAIASYIQERWERYQNLPHQEIGPIAVVLCKGCESTEEIYDLFLKIFECVKYKPSICLAIPPMDNTRLYQFHKQCDILVATPMTLLWLLKSRLVNLKRLCHFVIEDGDIILEKFPNEMEIIFGVMQNMLEHRTCNYSIQMMVASEKWNVQLEKLFKNLNYVPTICINNYLEAALYGRVNFELLFVKEHHKRSQIVDIVGSKMHLYKTIIFCNTQSEINDVLEYLQLQGISAVQINSSNTKEEIYEYETSWMNSNTQNFVLLCTDEVFLNSLDITDATLLIHYSLPDSWTYFSCRFKTMIDNLSSPLSSKQMDEDLYCKTYIFVDQSCEMQFPRLVELLQRLNKTLPSKYMDHYHAEKRKEEAKRIENKIKLCKHLKLFGSCEKVKCPKRHVLSKQLDLNDSLPARGTVNFTLLHVEEVNTFYVKLLQFTDTDGHVVIKKNKDDYDEMEEAFNEVINLEKDYAYDLVVGDIYAVLDGDKLKRCRLLKVVKGATKNRTVTKHVIIKLLDYGPHLRVNPLSLYSLPKDFQSITPRAFTLHLGNLVPPDGDEKWSSDCKSKLKNALSAMDYNNERSYFSSEVLLILGQELWVNNVHLYENIDTFRTKAIKMNVKKMLKDLNIVTEIEEPMECLYKMCKEADIALPEFAVPERSNLKSFEQVKPNWAFLDEGSDYTEVYLSSVISPNQFFVRLKKFDDLLQTLQREINIAIQRPLYPSNFVVVNGYSYLAKDENTEEYRRALVSNVEDNIARVFFVDYGTTADVDAETLKFMDESFITKLPYQAIECHLYGIEPYGDSWQNNANKILCDYRLDEAADRTLYAYTYDDKKTGHLSFNLNYGVVLLCYNDQSKPVFINQLLVDCGEAVSPEDKDFNSNITLPKIENEEDEEELEKELGEEATNHRDNSSFYDDCDSNSSSDAVILDKDLFLEHFGIMISRALKEETKPAICDNPDKYLPIVKALPPAEYSTPSIIWYQTEELIHITILLPSVDQFEMQLVREKFLHFWTIQNGKEYRLNLIFYAKLKKDFKSTTGMNIKATFVKQERAEWPRLESTPSRKNIKYDVNKIDIPEEAEEKRFLDLNLDDDVEDDMNDIIIGSDEDDSESDLESISD